MLFAPPAPHSQETTVELAHYSRQLHQYTLRLWTESRRLAEEKTRSRDSSTDRTHSGRRRGSDTSSSASGDESAGPRGRSSYLSRGRSDESASDRERQHKRGRKDNGSDLGARMAAVAI